MVFGYRVSSNGDYEMGMFDKGKFIKGLIRKTCPDGEE